MRVSVFGLGKLGLCTAACIARAGIETIGVDVNADHVARIERGDLPFEETDLATTLEQARPNLRFTLDAGEAIASSDLTLIIVPTPSGENGAFSNEYILAVLRAIAPLIRDKHSFHVVDVVSTVMPGTGSNSFIPLLEQTTGKKAGSHPDGFGFAYNPEFIAIGSVIRDFLNPDLVLIGASDTTTGDRVQELYEKVCDNTPYFGRCSIIDAELCKLSINCYCTMKISFANNLAAVCQNMEGADATAITAIMGHDTRIGQKYIKPGLGFGGPCFPRDNEAFVAHMQQAGGDPALQQAVVQINNAQVERVVRSVADAAQACGPRVALLGQAYKPHTWLTERSQAVDAAKELARRHPELELRVFDPMAREQGPWTLCDSLKDCVQDANVAAVLTPWPQFMQHDWHSHLAQGARVLDFWA